VNQTIHVTYTYVAYYIFPILSICTIYIFIYYRVKKTKNCAQMLVRTIQKDKRDLEVLRNISMLLGIYLMGGVPTLLFLVTSNRIFYLISIVMISLTVAVEKVCTILLDRELRQVIRKIAPKTTRITPFNNTHTTARY
jgi:hypothetical protein